MAWGELAKNERTPQSMMDALEGLGKWKYMQEHGLITDADVREAREFMERPQRPDELSYDIPEKNYPNVNIENKVKFKLVNPTPESRQRDVLFEFFEKTNKANEAYNTGKISQQERDKLRQQYMLERLQKESQIRGK